MTAVEWLLGNLITEPYSEADFKHNEECWDKAKEMEKQQIIDAVEWGNRKGYDEHILTCIYDDDVRYYNETFKSE